MAMNDAKNWRHAVMLESGGVAHVELSVSRGYRTNNPNLSFDLDRKELVLRFRVEVMSESCKQCCEPASVQFVWPTSKGPQEAALCQQHADEWWKTYQHTPAGLGLVITGL